MSRIFNDIAEAIGNVVPFPAVCHFSAWLFANLNNNPGRLADLISTAA